MKNDDGPSLHSLGFIGAGNMAEAMIRGVLRQGLVPPAKVTVHDIAHGRTRHLADVCGVATALTLPEIVSHAETVVLAVKPQNVPTVLPALREALEAGGAEGVRCRRLLSICAGISTATLEAGLAGAPGNGGSPIGVVRVMPNLAASVGQAASAIAAGASASQEDVAVARCIMEAVGDAIVLDERHINAVTGLSGSGPAYVYYFLEALIAGGEAAGLPPDAARRLALRTVSGAVALALAAAESPADLRAAVTSAGGTTEAGIHVLAKGGFDRLVVDAVKAATRRAEELGS